MVIAAQINIPGTKESTTHIGEKRTLGWFAGFSLFIN